MTVAAATPLATAPTERDAREALAKYFQIADLAEKAPEMFSSFIDAEWHRLLDEKEDYTPRPQSSISARARRHVRLAPRPR